MKAIILAAGIGSRLRPLTNNIPKCLVEVNNKSIIEYQIDAYLEAKVEEIIIITGYLSKHLVEFIQKKYKSENIKFIENKNYNDTNNMYSLYLAKDYLLDKNFILSNADVVFDKNMVKDLISYNDNTSLISVDKGNFLDESMKIIVKDETITSISKQIKKSDAYGVSIDLYKFNKSDSNILFEEIKKIIEVEKNLNSWTEVALNNILNKTNFKPFDIENKFWYEIDNHEDLKIAKDIVKRG